MARKKLVLSLLGLTGVVASGAIALHYFIQTKTESLLLTLARVVPQQALTIGYISTNNQTWNTFTQFALPFDQKAVDNGFKVIDQSILGNTNVSFQKDLLPLFNGLLVAVLPDHSPQPSSDSTILIAAQVKDEVGLLTLQDKLKNQSGNQIREVKIQEVPVVEIVTPHLNSPEDQNQGTQTTQTNHYVALVNQTVILTNHRTTMEQAIATTKGSPSLVQRQGMNNILAHSDFPSPVLMELFIPDYPALVNQTQQQLNTIPPLSYPPVQSAIIRMGVVDQEGIRVRVGFTLDAKTANLTYQSTEGKILDHLPQETFALINGRGVNQLWKMLINQAKTDSKVSEAVNRIREQFQSWKLDADQDIFSWMDGEFALGMISPSQGFLPPLGFGLGVVLETNDRRKTEATLTALNQVAEQNFLQVKPRNLGGKEVTEWRDANGQSTVLGYGWVNGNTIFGGIGQPIVEMLAQTPKVSLRKDERFQRVSNSLPSPNGGYVYLNVDSGTSALMKGLFQPQGGELRPEVKAITNSVRGVGVTFIQPNSLTGQLEAIVSLKPNVKK